MNNISNRLSLFYTHQLQNDFKHRLHSEVEIEKVKLSNIHDVKNKNPLPVFSATGISSNDFEELGFMMQKTIESKNKSLRRRKITGENIVHLGDKDERLKRIEDIRKLEKIYNMLQKGTDSGHLEKQANGLLDLAKNGDEISFSDSAIPAANYIQLVKAESIAVEKNEKEAEKNIRKKIIDLESDENTDRQIKAGFNTAEIFSEMFDNYNDIVKALNFYHSHIMTAKNISEMLRALAGFKGWDKFAQTVEIMRDAVRRDLNASEISTDPRLLMSKVRDMQRINMMCSVASDCAEFLRTKVGLGGVRV